MRRITLYSILAITCASPATSFAASIPGAIMRNDNIGSIGYVNLHQHYTETGTNIATNGNVFTGTLDKETGNLSGIELDTASQWSHIGIRTHILYAAGNTAYDGHALSNNAPTTGTTQNKLFDASFGLNYGFSFAALPDLAFMPSLEVGYNIWNRDLGSYSEVYLNGYWLGKLGLQYAVTPYLIVDGGYGAGRTVSPRMDSGLTSQTYTLGTAGISRGWIGVDFVLGGHLKLYAKYSATSYRYLASAADANGYYEPDSKTVHDAVSAGIGLRF